MNFQPRISGRAGRSGLGGAWVVRFGGKETPGAKGDGLVFVFGI